MNQVLEGIPEVFCYLDDVIIMSKAQSLHEKTLHRVFQRLKEHGLVVNGSKCILAVPSLSFLSFHVSSEGLSPLPHKVTAITGFSLPRTPLQLNHSLACTNITQSLLKITLIFCNLFMLLLPQVPRIKSQEALAKATPLSFPDPNSKTELVVDASRFCIGAVLQQIQDGSPRSLAFWLKVLIEAQISWSNFERELYASYSAIMHFQYFLEAKALVPKADH